MWSPQRGGAASPPFLSGLAPAHPDAFTTGEGAEPPRPRATRRVAPPGSHEFCAACERHGRSRVPTVLWGTACAKGGRSTPGCSFLALILMGDRCDSVDGVDTTSSENRGAPQGSHLVKEPKTRRVHAASGSQRRAEELFSPLTGAFEMGDPFSSSHTSDLKGGWHLGLWLYTLS